MKKKGRLTLTKRKSNSAMNLNRQDATHESAKKGLKGGYITETFVFTNVLAGLIIGLFI